jgi:hypothetical protein
MFRTTDIKRRKSRNDNFYATVKNPQRLSSGSVKRILVRAFYEQGLREDLAEGERRHEFKGAHGFRKFYKTRAEQVMNRLNVEFLMGHSIGLNSNYYRPTEQELLTDFLKAIPALTISEDMANIKRQQEILEQKQQEKDQELEQMREQLRRIKEAEVQRSVELDQIIKEMDLIKRSIDLYAKQKNEEHKDAAAGQG